MSLSANAAEWSPTNFAWTDTRSGDPKPKQNYFNHQSSTSNHQPAIINHQSLIIDLNEIQPSKIKYINKNQPGVQHRTLRTNACTKNTGAIGHFKQGRTVVHWFTASPHKKKNKIKNISLVRTRAYPTKTRVRTI
jgi:hypothetical protein